MRYFIEVAYKGTNYSGFQKQENSNSIQSEVEKALSVYYRKNFDLTGASRTDTGVHAVQNYFHFDVDDQLNNTDKHIHHVNAILPPDIVIKRIVEVKENAHCRFDALSRQYRYNIYSRKDPFQADRAYYFPYRVDDQTLSKAAALLATYNDFGTFSKRNSQVNNFLCRLDQSEWVRKDGMLVYTVRGNRFLRGMVRGLVGTMLKVGTGKITVEEFKSIVENGDASRADFSVPGHGLFLMSVIYPSELFL